MHSVGRSIYPFAGAPSARLISMRGRLTGVPELPGRGAWSESREKFGKGFVLGNPSGSGMEDRRSDPLPFEIILLNVVRERVDGRREENGVGFMLGLI